MSVHDKFNLEGKTAVITGGAGLLGQKHAEALMEYGANCILVDVAYKRAVELAGELGNRYEGRAIPCGASITEKAEVEEVLALGIKEFGSVDILVNNAANNPKYEEIEGKIDLSKRFETYPVESWQKDLDVGLKGSFLCTQVLGTYFAQRGKGIILNIASDLGVIAPDQRIYRKDGLKEEEQSTKPVTYSVVKTGLIGMTRYTATYWADKNVRCNALVPGGVYTGQNEEFVTKLTNLIPMGRMADVEEYKAAVVFMCSDASAYMTGTTVVMDGGRTCW